jgi:hypothetical protein
VLAIEPSTSKSSAARIGFLHASTGYLQLGASLRLKHEFEVELFRAGGLLSNSAMWGRRSPGPTYNVRL